MARAMGVFLLNTIKENQLRPGCSSRTCGVGVPIMRDKHF